MGFLPFLNFGSHIVTFDAYEPTVRVEKSGNEVGGLGYPHLGENVAIVQLFRCSAGLYFDGLGGWDWKALDFDLNAALGWGNVASCVCGES